MNHAGVFVATEPDTENCRLAGQTALAEGHQTIQKEPFDTINAVARKQHPVVGPEQATFMNGNEIKPVPVRLKGIFDFRCIDADIVVVVGSP